MSENLVFDLAPFNINGVTYLGEVSKEYLGGKGCGLVEMSRIGIPVPPGFVIPTKYCVEYFNAGQEEAETLVRALAKTAREMIERIYTENKTPMRPLVSIRSGARVSMPGMMDTILNVGLTKDSLKYYEKHLGNWSARDSYRRLIQMYGTVVKGIDGGKFEQILDKVKINNKKTKDSDLTQIMMLTVCKKFLALYEDETGEQFPTAVEDQLVGAIEAVFKSWNNDRAKAYREIHNYSDDWGTAVTVQTMVFGNLNDKSGSGVMFTRDPSTGADEIIGEFLPCAQGEDVVAGIRTPMSISELPSVYPEVVDPLLDAVQKLEEYYKDMQDVEFTIQDGSFYVLQTRSAKRSSEAALKVAYDLWQSGDITLDVVRDRISAEDFTKASTVKVGGSAQDPFAVGIPAGGGLVSGYPVTTLEQAKSLITLGKQAILVLQETTPDDIEVMNISAGIITFIGGLTSHAAVVARGLNKTCVVGLKDSGLKMSEFDKALGMFKLPDSRPLVTVDGKTGSVWVGVDVPTIGGTLPAEGEAILKAFKKQSSDILTPSEDTVIIVLDDFVKDLKLVTAVNNLADKIIENLEVGRLVVLHTGDIEDMRWLRAIAQADFKIKLIQHLCLRLINLVEEQPILKNLYITGVLTNKISALPEAQAFTIPITPTTVKDFLSTSNPIEVTRDVISSLFVDDATYKIFKDMCNSCGVVVPLAKKVVLNNEELPYQLFSSRVV